MRQVAAAFPGGLKLPTGKHLTNSRTSLRVPLPERIVLPLQQHIGLPAVPAVQVGEHVLKGQVVAAAESYVCVPTHASTSGRVVAIEQRRVPGAMQSRQLCIIIEVDGEDRWGPMAPIPSFHRLEPAALQQVIQQCGIVGLGGAGFPAHVKLREGTENAVDTLIINGVECEPWISCDDRLIREKAHYVVQGTRMIAHAVQARHSILAVEGDMPEAAAALAEHIDTDEVDLVMVESRYPAGGEKQLIETLTGREVPSGGLPIHVGIVMHNVATAAAVYRAVTRGEPMVSRYVTVTGEVERPRNLQVLLGTPVADCLRLCDDQPLPGRRVIVGGPMMGTALDDTDLPVTKTVNCILLQQASPPPQEQPCIRCGQCVEVCPVRLQPQELLRFARADMLQNAREARLFDCIECGCCAYACPSHIPLVHYYREAKAAIAEWERSREGTDRARARILAREQRLREQEEQRGAALPAAASPEQRRAYVREAVQRARHKREHPPT